mmetsp:Transcript_38958/g.70926  ORF Transcript_38958/g.70926 Transcript_38958/m.70926 type:complete len:178 (+) Transcript_38958:56-589(+)
MERSSISTLTLDELRRPFPPRHYHSCAMFGDKYMQSYVEQLLESSAETTAGGSDAASESDEEEKIICLSEMEAGMVVEGTIVRTCRIGLFVDVHAEVLGYLPWRALQGVPRKYIRKGEALGNLEVAKVDLMKRQLSLKIYPIVGRSFPSNDYEEIENQVGEWAFTPPHLRNPPPAEE